MLWKCCTQYASKFGKLSSGHRTGKGQFSFQSQRKAMTKNAQTTAQLHSFHTLAKKCSKFSKLGINGTWTENFQMLKLDLEKAEEPEIKLPTSTGSQKKQENSRKTPTSALLTTLKPLCGSQQTGKFLWKEMGIPDHQRRQWHPTPVLLPGKSREWRSLVGCSPWGHRVRHDWSDLAAAAYQTTLLTSWKTCMQVKRQVRTGHGTTDWFQIG